VLREGFSSFQKLSFFKFSKPNLPNQSRLFQSDFFQEAETTYKLHLEHGSSWTVGVLGLKKANQNFSIETSQSETKALKQFSTGGEKAFQVFKEPAFFFFSSVHLKYL
jgi:hypothetical protein